MKLAAFTVLALVAFGIERLTCWASVSWLGILLEPAFPPLQGRPGILLLVSASTVFLIHAVALAVTSPKTKFG